MAEVFEAEDETTGRTVALKRLLARRAGRDDEVLRFEREFHTLARLAHPRIVEVYDYGLSDEGPYYTMELLDGEDLRDIGQVDPARACGLLRDVARALAFLHTRRLIHRDLAPRNVRCTRDGRAKLLDFGVLASVGVSRDTAGTPPYMAPENVRGLPLDHRVDLYGLGALAYRLLTGRNAYPARSLDDLDDVWGQRPPAPAQLVPETPRGLSDLVMSLLSLDPLGRPSSAVEVSDRLTALGDLHEESSPEQRPDQGGYLVSTELVGRRSELEQLRRMLAAARRGQGRAFAIEAPSGNGKSRLLREAGLRAQLEGLWVVEARGSSADEGALGLLRAIAKGMVEADPVEAVGAARPHAPLIARVLPELRDRLPQIARAPAFSDPAEERLRLQEALSAWLIDVAKRRPLCILIDDLQRADEASVAVLASTALTGSGQPLIIGAAIRTDEEVRAPAAVRVLTSSAERIRLEGLDADGVQNLVRGLFGDVPSLPRLATALHRAAGGNPMHTTELVHGLVADGVIRFVDGLWVIRDLQGVQLAESLAPAIERRLRGLSADARALAEVLAIHGGEPSLDLVVALAPPEFARTQTFAALSELMEQEVLVAASDRYRFRHDGIREAVLRGVNPSELWLLHRRVGHTLDRADLDERDELRVGWHLLRGREEIRGGELLERAGRRLYTAQSFTEAIGPLEAALEVRSLRPGARRGEIELRHMLLMAGCMADRNVAIRHIDTLIADYRHHGGITIAERLGPFCGRVLALMLGLTWRLLGWLLTWPSRRGPFPVLALANFFIAVGFSATVHSLSYDITKLREVIALARPLAVFERGINYGVFLLAECLLRFPLGQFGSVRRSATRMIEMVEREKTKRYSPLSELDLRTGEGGCRLMLALIDVAEQDPKYVEELERLAELDLRYFELGQLQARLAFHRSRGEEEQAQRLLRDVEVMLVQLGAAWQMETWLSVASALAYGMNRDVLGLKRSIEELRDLVARGLKFEGALELTLGEYHRERGELDVALTHLERALDIIPDEVQTFHQPTMAALADTLVARGEFKRAVAVAREGYALSTDPESGQFANRIRSARAWAFAEAGLGDHERAARRLDQELAAAASRASPCLSGSLHEARAIVARQQGDRPSYDRHRLSAERFFVASRNPALIARVERLIDFRAERATAPAVSDERSTAVVDNAETIVPGSSLLAGCGTAAQRRRLALRLILEATDASVGYLLLAGDPALGDEDAGPEGLDPDLLEAMRDAMTVRTTSDVTTLTGDGSHWRIVSLMDAEDPAGIVVGVVALRQCLQRPSSGFLAQLARELLERGDVRNIDASTGPSPTEVWVCA
jgi:tetratricopeptide (TPR) repeat protein